MSKNVFLFSGQGSQSVGMGVELIERFSSAKAVFDTASDILGFDLEDKVRNADMEEISRTVISQPAIMAVSLAAYKAVSENGISASAAAGHSLGEYAALVVSGIVSIEDGFRLIKARSEAMQKAADSTDGSMYAIMGKDLSSVEKVCEETEGYVIPVNYNSLGQIVIAGETPAAAAAAEKLSASGLKAVKLGVSSAFHSKLMQSAADEFITTAKTISYNAPQIEFYSNISGDVLTDVSDMAERLAKHIVSPVRFTDELTNMQKAGYDRYIELGPGKVLSGCVKKTLKGVEIFNVENSATLDKLIEA